VFRPQRVVGGRSRSRKENSTVPVILSPPSWTSGCVQQGTRPNGDTSQAVLEHQRWQRRLATANRNERRANVSLPALVNLATGQSSLCRTARADTPLLRNRFPNCEAVLLWRRRTLDFSFNSGCIYCLVYRFRRSRALRFDKRVIVTSNWDKQGEDVTHQVKCRFRSLLALGWLLLAATIARSAPDPSGRWEGVAEIPGAPMRVIVDIARDSQRKWVGSVILPALGVKGAALNDLAVTDADVRFGITSAFSIPLEPAPDVHLTRRTDGALAGELHEGGHAARLILKRTGPPQVDMAPPSTAISAALEGTWIGRYELGGYARDVTLTLANDPLGAASGEIVVVGKRTTTLPVDHVVQGAEFITLQSNEAGFRIEGRWATADGTIQGQMMQGPFEAALVLRRAAGVREKSP
jgi:hypothetical protein